MREMHNDGMRRDAQSEQALVSHGLGIAEEILDPRARSEETRKAAGKTKHEIKKRGCQKGDQGEERRKLVASRPPKRLTASLQRPSDGAANARPTSLLQKPSGCAARKRLITRHTHLGHAADNQYANTTTNTPDGKSPATKSPGGLPQRGKGCAA